MSTTPTAPVSPAAGNVQSVVDALAMGLSLAFPQFAPVFAASDKALAALVPWILAAVQGKTITLADLKAMQTDLNSFGPSFPAAGGYSNAFAGGPAPAPGTTPELAPANSATLTINGGTVTVRADTLQALMTVLGAIVVKPST